MINEEAGHRSPRPQRRFAPPSHIVLERPRTPWLLQHHPVPPPHLA